MGNSGSANDQPPSFALPRQQIVTVGSIHDQTAQQDLPRPTEQNVVAVKVCTLEKPMLVKSPDDTYRVVAELTNASPDVEAQLYLQARLEAPKQSDFPSIVLDREAGTQADIALQGPFAGSVTGNQVSFGAIVRLDRWPASVRAQDTKRRRCPVVIKVSRKAVGNEVPEGTGIYTFCIGADNSLVLTLRLVQGPYGPCVIHNIYGRDEEDAMCIFCLSEPRTTAVVPCLHMCLCSTCAVTTRMRIGAMQTCPICRRDVKDLIQINFPAKVTAAEPAVAAEATQEQSAAPVVVAVLPSEVDPVVAATAPSEDAEQIVRTAAEMVIGAMENDGPMESNGEDGTISVEQGDLPPNVTRRLAKEIQAIGKRKDELLRDHGLEFTWGDDMRFSTFRLFTDKLSPTTVLGCELRNKSIIAMEFEVMVSHAYPVAPPHVRLVSPQISAGNFFVQKHGALCLEVLSPSGWSPALTIEQVALQIKSMMADAKGSIGMSIFSASYSREGAWSTAKAVESYHENHGWG
eukprot:GEMP01043082.1.p1 GENE.GEMP01043082.1~~GEMP01043082.1.p1  ORF type:complete len:517 (+),score=113.30 GEMP01043082.1:126-1676(+)